MASVTIGPPAHAGIDLNAASESPWLGWFPRTRGDRPADGAKVFAVIGVPPHTRG